MNRRDFLALSSLAAAGLSTRRYFDLGSWSWRHFDTVDALTSVLNAYGPQAALWDRRWSSEQVFKALGVRPILLDAHDPGTAGDYRTAREAHAEARRRFLDDHVLTRLTNPDTLK